MFRLGTQRGALAMVVLAAGLTTGARAEPWAGAESSQWQLRLDANASRPVAKAGPPKNSFMAFGGPLVSARLGRVFEGNLDDGLSPAAFVGVAASREVARMGDFAMEFEGGVGALIGRRQSVSTPQVWAAAFLRYDGFFWNDIVRTSVAASTGLNWSSRSSPAERASAQPSPRLMHYLAPEITLAVPSRSDRELALRLHHRSSVWGLFGCRRCALNVLTLGVRQRF